MPATKHQRHFEDLSPDDFERLVYWLVKRSGEFDEVQWYGGARDKGRDVVAYKHSPAGREKWYIQCKRYQSINFSTLRDELDKLAEHAEEEPDFAPNVIVFATACPVPPQAKDQAAAQARALNLPEPYYWGRLELDERLKTQPQTEAEFFDVYARPPIGVPFQAPPLPAHFVPRPEMSSELKARLLVGEPATPGALVVSAVHGLGGIGKTTLVAHLAHDAEIQARFSDGILWVTLGQEPDALSLLAGWIQALGDYDFHPTTIEMASSHLRTLLHDKACLLVVDDAWHADHVRAFLVGEERCRVLVTTRDATLARKVGARLYDLEVMTEAQALALFEARLGPLGGNRKQSAALARELGYLPLALELAAAQVEAGLSWVELLDTFRRELANLATLDQDEATYRNEGLRLSFRLSLERLSTEDREAFAWLGVLPEDVMLNPAMAATLWGKSEANARKLLFRLQDKALLKPAGDDCHTIHDLLRDESKLQLTERMSLMEAHAAFLCRYRQKMPDDRWDQLPYDGYIQEHLTWHIEQAGQVEAIHTLMCLETSDGCNAWYQAREASGQIAGYLDDVRRAWRLVENKHAGAPLSSHISLQCRYALIIASLNSLAKNLPPALLAALIEHEIWAPIQGLAYAQQAPDSGQQAEALVNIVSYLPDDSLIHTLNASQQIWNEHDRAEVISALAHRLPESRVGQVLDTAQQFQLPGARAKVLAALAPRLLAGEKEKILIEVLETLRKVDRSFVRSEILSLVAPYLEEDLLNQAREIALELDDTEAQILALCAMLPYIRTEEQRRSISYIMNTMEQIWRPSFRAQVLATLIAYSPAEDRDGLLTQCLRLIWNIDASTRVQVLSQLGPYLPERLLPQVFEALEGLDLQDFAFAICALLPSLSSEKREQQITQVLEATSQIEQPVTRALVLTLLAPHLPVAERKQTLIQALSNAQQIGDNEVRIQAFLALASHLPEDVLEFTLQDIGAYDDDFICSQGLPALAPHLPERLLSQALQIVLQIDNEHARLKALSVLAPYLSNRLLPQALQIAQQIGSNIVRVHALSALVPHLSQSLLVQTLQIAQKTTRPNARAFALAALMPRLPSEMQETIATQILQAMHEIEDVEECVEALSRLAQSMPEFILSDVLQIVRRIRRPDDRARALVSLAIHLPAGEQREEILEKSYQTALTIKWPLTLLRALLPLVPYLSGKKQRESLSKILTAMKHTKDANARAETISAVASYLSDDHLTRALRLAQQIWPPRARAQALLALIPHLPDSAFDKTLTQTLHAIQGIRSIDGQAKAFSALAPHLSRNSLNQLMANTRQLEDNHARARILAALIPHLPLAEQQEALIQALEAASRIGWYVARAQALSDLAPHMSALPLDTLYSIWCKMLPALAVHTRQAMIAYLQALSPVIAALGGVEAIPQTVHAIQDVGRWWP